MNVITEMIPRTSVWNEIKMHVSRSIQRAQENERELIGSDPQTRKTAAEKS
jgi:hypothetical protein